MRISVKTIGEKKKKREKISALTAYDFPFARILDRAGLDIILVGDSLGMVLLGYGSTLPVTMRDMLHHTKAVSRAVERALVVADMPFGSYDEPAKAVRNAKRFLKEAGADAVKVEGGAVIEKTVQALIRSGVPVMGHVGMTPQTASSLGGYRVQGTKSKEAQKIMRDAKLLDRLGVFAIVLECVPSGLARRITKAVHSPTIGIGAGASTDGQILVLHDLLGFESSVRPCFVRRYADLNRTVSKAVSDYRQDVVKGNFPSGEESY